LQVMTFLRGVLLLILSWMGSLGLLKANVYHRYDQRLEDAIAFINNVQQPDNCTGLEYLVMDIGIHGGFAAQFQLAAKEWMHMFAAYNYSVPVLIQGRIIGYSDHSACDHTKHEWTCYFQPMSECEETIRKTGKQLAFSRPRRWSPVPDQFEKYGYAFWWGVVQYKMFQLQPVVAEHIHALAALMNHGNGFPFGLPLAGLHVRHGDKRTDGFREHSLDEELNFLRRSPDCAVINSAGDCFTRLNVTAHSSMVTLHRVAKKHGIVLDRSSVDRFNRTSTTGNSEIAVDPRSLWSTHSNHHGHPGHHGGGHNHHNVTSGSIGNTTAPDSTVAHDAELVIPVQLFVASDDVSVVTSASRQGYLTGPIGVSQGTTTAQDGMLKTLLSHPEIAHRATLEILSDIYFLSQCNTLIGISASQVFRMAVALSNVTGTLHFAAAMDGDQIRRVQQLSNKYDIPFPETFYLGR
jgi:hypothetical protein